MYIGLQHNTPGHSENLRHKECMFDTLDATADNKLYYPLASGMQQLHLVLVKLQGNHCWAGPQLALLLP